MHVHKTNDRLLPLWSQKIYTANYSYYHHYYYQIKIQYG